MNKRVNALSLSSLAARLGVSKHTVYKWVDQGLQFQQHGQRAIKYFHIQDLNRFASQKPYLFGGIDSDRLELVFGNSTLAKKCSSLPAMPHPRCKPVRCVETGQVFASRSDAAKAAIITRPCICRAARKGVESAGYHWVSASFDELLEQLQVKESA